MAQQILAFSSFNFFANFLFFQTFWRDTIVIYALNDQTHSQKVVVNHTEKFVSWVSRYSHFQVFLFRKLLFWGHVGGIRSSYILSMITHSQKLVVSRTKKFVAWLSRYQHFQVSTFFANFLCFFQTFWRDTIVINALNDQTHSQKVVVNHTEKFVSLVSRYSHFQVFIFSQTCFGGHVGGIRSSYILSMITHSQKLVVSRTKKFVAWLSRYQHFQVLFFSQIFYLFLDILEGYDHIYPFHEYTFIESSCEPH